MNKNRKKYSLIFDYSGGESLDFYIRKFLDYLEKSKRYSSLTIRNYSYYLRRFSLWFKINSPRGKLYDIDFNLVDKYKKHLEFLKSENGFEIKKVTQAYHIVALRVFLKHFRYKKIGLSSVDFDKIQVPKFERESIEFLNSKQVNKIMLAPRLSDLKGFRNKAILETLYSTGLLVSELVSLDRDKVDLRRREFGIIGRGKRPRVVFLSERATLWLKRYLYKRRDGYRPLFIKLKGKVNKGDRGEGMRLSVRTIQRVVKKYAEKAKIPFTVTAQTLRNSFAADLLSHGADLQSVQDILGHKSIATTKKYAEEVNSHLRKVHKIFHSGSRK